MRRPFVLSVLGLKDSGKTTLACGLISGLGALGLSVAALKNTHVTTLTLDAHGTDSAALWEAGARFVAVRSRSQTMTMERHPAGDPSSELLELVPPSVDLVVAEGLLPPGPESPRAIVCLRRFEELEISVTPAPERERLTIDRAGAERFADLGVNRLILYSPRARDESSLLALIDEVGTNLIGKL